MEKKEIFAILSVTLFMLILFMENGTHTIKPLIYLGAVFGILARFFF